MYGKLTNLYGVQNATPLLILVLVCMTAYPYPVCAVVIPPVRYSGYLLASISKATQSGRDEDILQQTQTANLNLDSYIWQPWFATTHGGIFLSHITTESDGEADNDVVTGDARVRVFPLSRFPFEAFVNVSDSRADIENVEGATNRASDFRNLQFGFNQQYQPAKGNSRYSARYEHDIQDNRLFSGENVSDRLLLQSSHKIKKHDFAFNANAEDLQLDEAGGGTDILSLTLTGRHFYKHSGNLSVENFGTLIDFDQQSDMTEFQRKSVNLNNRNVWRSSKRPLVVSSDARFAMDETDDGVTSTKDYFTNLGIDANYEITPHLRTSGSARAAITRGDTEREATSQSGTLSYTPALIDFRGYNYNWFATGTLSNTTSSESEGSQQAGALIGHNISRTKPFGSPPVLMTVALNQALSSDYSSLAGTSETLTNIGSLNLVRSAGRSSAQLFLTLTDTRVFGDTTGFSGDVQTATLTGLYNLKVSPYESWNAALSTQTTRRSGDADGSQSFDFSSLDIDYQNNRLFGVRRLQFLSQLHLSSENLIPFRDSDVDSLGGTQPAEKSWENDLLYSIGRLSFRLRGVISERGDDRNTFVLLTVSRNFGGIL